MLDIDNLIKQSKEISIDEEKLEIEGINSYVCNRIVENFGIISKYIIFEYSELFTKGVFESVETFVSFQRKKIGPFFYNFRDDIRWNIYLIIVFPNSIAFDGILAAIEKNDEYSRKIFMREDDFIKFIKYGMLGDIGHKSSLALKTDILLIWDEELDKIGANGCLYNKFESKHVTDFISEGKKILPVGRPSQRFRKENTLTKRDELTIKSIENLKITDFRSHCLGKELDLKVSKMNLISGSNGCGKSSICEAVSYALTGNSSDKSGTVVANCINKQGNHVIHKSKKTLNDQRALDLLWYGTVTIGYKTSLHKNFRIFNYLDTTPQNDEKIDINEILKNLIYGEETVESRKLLNRYYEEFTTHLKSMQKERKEITDYILELTQKKDQNSYYIVDTTDLLRDLVRIGFQDYSLDKLNETDSLNNLKDKFLYVTNSVETIQDYLVDSYDINTVNDITDRLDEYKNRYDELNKNLPNENVVTLELESIMKQLSENEVDKSKYENDISVYTTIRNTVLEINNDKIIDQDSINLFINKFIDAQKKIKQLTSLQAEYMDIYTKSIQEYTEKDLIQIDIVIEEIKSSVLELENSIDEKKNRLTSFVRLKSDLFDIGKKVLQENNTSTTCPLCNHLFSTRSDLEDAIKISIDLSDSFTQEISEIEKERNSLQNTLNEKNKIKAEIDSNLKRSRMRNQFLKILHENYGIKGESLKLSDTRNLVDNMIIEYKTFVSRNEYNYELLNDIMKTHIYNLYCEVPETQNFISFLDTNLKVFASSLNAVMKEIDMGNKRKSILEGKLSNIIDLKSKLANLGSDINDLNAVISSFEIIKDSFPIILNSQDLREWIVLYTNILNYINQITINLNKAKESKHLDELISEQNEKLEGVINKINSCKSVTNIISSLPKLEDNMHEFISENASQIEHIFRLIHRPKEFSDLRIENGEISFIRESTQERIKQNEISTGQNISLMFSIMLCLYLSAQNAPQIILLDEPVANMDDMHILNLIDILRELILKDTQIFFTTANDQVASFLRRKFSFFGSSFKHVMLERNDAKPSKITEINYQYNNEEPIIIKRHA